MDFQRMSKEQPKTSGKKLQLLFHFLWETGISKM